MWVHLTLGLPELLLQQSSYLALNDELNGPVFAANLYQVNRTPFPSRYLGNSGMMPLDEVLNQLERTTNHDDNVPTINHGFLFTNEPYIEAELIKISERHKSLNEYFWILGERLDLPVSTVIRVLTEHGGESLNLGFLRYSPFLNPEDCESRLHHPYMVSVAKRLFGCDLQHLPDRVSATIHQIIKLTLVFTIHTEGEQPNERPLSCNGMQSGEVYNLGLSLYTRFQKVSIRQGYDCLCIQVASIVSI
ncbi:hypothetical protein PHET_07063 [Paragonimus heterotremus]|uniref:Uncharacterized protein n=1 Tax=Paragonimus heterotremus TaxID=100268 RepID=A0A8J4WQ88_9TREM|nr:hypothetical protein PHET_07063 [Paragonimus heterotremus]